MTICHHASCRKAADANWLDSCLHAYLRILLVFLTIAANAPVASKEAVISEQIGQLTGVTAYLHVHVELSISSVEAQLNKYQELLLEHCSSEDAIVNFMSTFPLDTDPSTTPRNYMVSNFSQPSATIRAHRKLWKTWDLDDIEHHVSLIQNALPPLPNW